MRFSLRFTSFLAALALIFAINACNTAKKVPPTQQSLIVGHWQLDSASVNGTTIPNELLGGNVSFVFKADGTAIFDGPGGESESGRYEVKDGKIYDPDNPEEYFMDIISLDPSKLVIRLTEEGVPVVMSLSRKK